VPKSKIESRAHYAPEPAWGWDLISEQEIRPSCSSVLTGVRRILECSSTGNVLPYRDADGSNGLRIYILYNLL